MPHSIETLASTRRKTKENIRVESLVPSQLRASSTRLIELLKDYYSHLNEIGQTSYEINSINNARDLDVAESKYIDLIQKEIAASIPKTLQNQILDKVKLYKNLMHYYSVRGSSDSIVLFFKILFNDTAEVYYPKGDMLIPSSGTWDKTGRRPVYDQSGNFVSYEDGIYTTNKGFLSDTIKLQDSYFYQQFSYVIRTGNNVDAWKNPFNKLVHPAGFIFFGEIVIFLENINHFSVTDDVGKDAQRIFSSMHRLQPGLIGDEDLPVNVFVGMPDNQALIKFPNKNSAEAYLRTSFTSAGKFNNIKLQVNNTSLAETWYKISLNVPLGEDQDNTIKFYDLIHNYSYRDVTIQDAESSSGSARLYPWADYTISDVLNNSLTWNDVHLGVNFI
jgi:hypothetical protein